MKRRFDTNKLAAYRPYTRQREFHEAGLTHRERLLMAANQVGKTYCGAAETAIHLTGEYPDWWPGRRWDRPIRAMAASKTGEVTRDGPQRYLLGEPKDKSQIGYGLIPLRCIVGRPTVRQGIAAAISGVVVKHKSGGNSTLSFKSYDQGREAMQADSLDLVWPDEEPPSDVYYEMLTRTNATGGMVMITFTPLLGMSTIVSEFIDAEESEDDV